MTIIYEGNGVMTRSALGATPSDDYATVGTLLGCAEAKATSKHSKSLTAAADFEWHCVQTETSYHTLKAYY